MTAVPSSMRLVRWLAAAMIATGEEIPGCRCRQRSHTLSKPSASARSMICSVSSMPGPGSAASKRPMVRKPSLRSGSPRRGMSVPLPRECARLDATHRVRPYNTRTLVWEFAQAATVAASAAGSSACATMSATSVIGLHLERLEHLGRDVVQVGLVALRDENR